MVMSAHRQNQEHRAGQQCPDPGRQPSSHELESNDAYHAAHVHKKKCRHPLDLGLGRYLLYLYPYRPQPRPRLRVLSLTMRWEDSLLKDRK